MLFRPTIRYSIPFLLAALAFAASTQQTEWLSLCGQCLSPSVTSKSGIGTAHAVVEGRITRKDAEAWCQNWRPQDDLAACIKDQLANETPNTVYRAEADCTKGRITAVDGRTLTQAGVWTDDIGKGRSRWRDSDGKIVGQDEASGGLAISQQWELLCPAASSVGARLAAPAAAKHPAAPPTSAAPKPAAPPALKPKYAVGEIVEAKFGSQWLRGKVTKIRQSQGANGPELNYDVALDNGQRGVLPSKLVRKVTN